MLNFKPVLPLLPLLTLAACAAPQGGFPSLEQRAYETDAPITAPSESAAAPAALSAELASKADALLTQHRTAHAEYLRRLPAVQTTASRAAGTSPGSENWVNAHLILSRLDKQRSDSVAALRDFDRLIADAGARDASAAALLTTAQIPIADDVAAQNVQIQRLSRLIGE